MAEKVRDRMSIRFYQREQQRTSPKQTRPSALAVGLKITFSDNFEYFLVDRPIGTRKTKKPPCVGTPSAGRGYRASRGGRGAGHRADPGPRHSAAASKRRSKGCRTSVSASKSTNTRYCVKVQAANLMRISASVTGVSRSSTRYPNFRKTVCIRKHWDDGIHTNHSRSDFRGDRELNFDGWNTLTRPRHPRHERFRAQSDCHSR
jgi:hypothetical protein